MNLLGFTCQICGQDVRTRLDFDAHMKFLHPREPRAKPRAPSHWTSSWLRVANMQHPDANRPKSDSAVILSRHRSSSDPSRSRGMYANASLLFGHFLHPSARSSSSFHASSWFDDIADPNAAQQCAHSAFLLPCVRVVIPQSTVSSDEQALFFSTAVPLVVTSKDLPPRHC